MTAALSGSTAALVAAVERIVSQLNARGNAELAGLPELTLRAFKAAEEAGELAAAVIGVTGQNPRKGVTHTWEDVSAEAIDVAITALVFAESAGPGVVAARLGRMATRPLLGGRGLVAAVERITATLNRRANPHMPALAELFGRGLRVQAAAGALAEAVLQVLSVVDPAAPGDVVVDVADPRVWNDAISEALQVATLALVFVESHWPGEVEHRLAGRLAYVAERAARPGAPAPAAVIRGVA